MGREYDKLECGCLISCDGGGSLIPCSFDDSNPDCKVKEYMNEHKFCGGYCKVCYPTEYKEALKHEIG